MRFGVLLSIDFASPGNGANAWDHVLEQCRVAESAGFDSVWVPTEIGWTRMEGLSLLGAIAASTQHVEVGSLVLLLPLYSPLHIAEAAATIDQVSHGRLVLGLGMGWRPDEFAASGVPIDARLSRFREGVPIIRKLLEGQILNVTGRNFTLHDVSLGVRPRQATVPIWIGAHSRRAVRRAAQLGDAWIGGPFQTLSEVKERFDLFGSSRPDQGAPVPRRPLVRDLVMGSPDEVGRNVHPYLVSKYREYRTNVGGMPFDVDGSFEDLARDRLIFGTPEDCAREVMRYAEEASVTDFIFRVEYRGMAPERALAVIETIGAELIPLCRPGTRTGATT